MKRSIFFTLGIAISLIANSQLSLAFAQNSPITLSIDVPSSDYALFNQNLIAGFLSQHPNVRVKFIQDYTPSLTAINMTNGNLKLLNTHAIDNFAQADVIPVGAFGKASLLSPDLTRLGYVLNLKPYVDSDPSYNPSALYPPPVARAFTWENGIWAIPTTIDPMVLVYQPKRFDQAGLAYPTDQWTIDDLINAIQKLAVSGSSISPSFGIFTPFEFSLLLSMYGKPLAPDVNGSTTPVLTDQALIDLFVKWEKLRQQQALFSFDMALPLMFSHLNYLLPYADPLHNSAGSVLPGGKTPLLTEGFAVSGGTAYPELAYQLAVYLAAHSTLGLDAFNNGIVFPARTDQINQIMPTLPPDVAKLLNQALSTGMSNADMLYGDYLQLALFRASNAATPGEDGQSILNDVQALALKNGDETRTSPRVSFSVTQYPDPPPLPPGKIALKFGVSLYTSEADQAPWQTFAAQFAQSDPLVGRVDLTISLGSTIEQAATQNDCFYQPYVSLSSSDSASLLNVDPLLSADPTIKADDIAPAALNQLTSQGHLWGIPLTISPAELRYSSYKLSANSLALVQDNWDVSAFVDFLKAAKNDSGSAPPFGSLNGDRDHWLPLIAAFGGLPIDYRTTPPTINFTAPSTVDAIRQTLDLAKQGYIAYSQLGTFRPISSQTSDTLLIRPDQLMAGYPSQIDQNKFEKLIAYPKGGHYTPISFTIGAGFISKTAANPDACYRLLSALAARPDLLMGMPARRSLLDSQPLLATQGPDAVAFYHKFDARLRDPAALIIPPEANLNGDTWIRYWLYQAFDAYVLNGKDLSAVLADAQSKASGFQQCLAALPPASPEPDITTVDNMLGCVRKVDPQLDNSPQ